MDFFFLFLLIFYNSLAKNSCIVLSLIISKISLTHSVCALFTCSLSNFEWIGILHPFNWDRQTPGSVSGVLDIQKVIT